MFSCGPASCHNSDPQWIDGQQNLKTRMDYTGRPTLHAMGKDTLGDLTKNFVFDLVADLRFEGNLNDSGTWNLHGMWALDGSLVQTPAGSYTTGHDAGQALGDQRPVWSQFHLIQPFARGFVVIQGEMHIHG